MASGNLQDLARVMRAADSSDLDGYARRFLEIAQGDSTPALARVAAHDAYRIVLREMNRRNGDNEQATIDELLAELDA